MNRLLNITVETKFGQMVNRFAATSLDLGCVSCILNYALLNTVKVRGATLSADQDLDENISHKATVIHNTV